MTMKYSWDDIAVLEATERGLVKAVGGKKFDPDVFNAVAQMELKKLRQETTKEG